ncbi:MAG TPA: polysaccharide pyruvyl transferase family protein [Bacteroidales bacterium]|nr:polysaccharide pyruvyl transferase family protein [Bacteroidales bacterium]
MNPSQIETNKFALLKYKAYNGLFNIGDYIQSLAAKQFLPKVDILLNREELDCYDGDYVKLIMNGWFLHEKEHWPPSEKIIPFFISFHLNSTAYLILDKSNIIEYFKKYEPIGCRDYETSKRLFEKGIKTYFSGCLTLTLGMTYFSSIRNDKVYFVDPYFEYKKDMLTFINGVSTFLINSQKIRIICSKLFSSKTLKNIIKSAIFYKQYSKIFDDDILVNSIYITHSLNEKQFPSEIDKFNHAEALLKIYSEAKLVITSRIHCALPCLGMETPVLYINNINSNVTSTCRLKGILDLLNVINYNKGKLEPIDLDITKIRRGEGIQNKNNYKTLKNGLIARCRSFVNKS